MHWSVPLVTSSRTPLITALTAGAIATGFVAWYYKEFPTAWSDYDQLWYGVRALLAGRDPYSEVPRRYPWPLYYPLPAVFLALPTAVLPLPFARAAFSGRGKPRWPAVLFGHTLHPPRETRQPHSVKRPWSHKVPLAEPILNGRIVNGHGP